MKHKRLSALLTAGLMLTTLPALPQDTPLFQRPALAANAATSGTCGENVTWKLKDGVLTISGTGAIKDYTLDERPFSGLSFSKAVISDGVTSIGDYTFMRCFGVKSITIPSSVKRFGNQAFYQCTALTDLTIPSSVTDIGLDVFNETPWLEAKQNENPLVIVNSILVDGRTCTGEVTIPDGVTRIGEYAFYLCKTMTDIQIPGSVTSIAGGAFSGCWELQSVTIPDGVTAIEGAAFARCYALTSVKIPNNVTSIGASAFLSCNSLTEIKIPYSVTSISDTAFEDCKKLTIKGYTGTIAETFAEENDIPFASLGNVPQPVVQSGNCGGNLTWTLDSSGTLKISGTGEMDDFDGGIPVWDSFQSNIRKVIIEDGVTSIGAYAFNGYEELQDISIPDSVQRFGIHAFSNTAWLAAMQDETPIVIVNHILISGNKSNEKELTVPDGVTFINDSAFRRSQELKKIVLPDSVTGIGQDAFYNCYALESVTLSERLTEIGDSAFRMCYALKDLVIPDGVTNIPQRAFMECTALESITIPASVTFIENDAFSDCSALTIKGYSGSYAESYAAENNIPFESLGEAPEVLLNGTCGENLIWELKDGVLTISGTGKMTNYTPEDSPFSGLSFSKAMISDGVTSIGNYAFASCSVLKEICIPESVTLIGSEAFGDCTALTEVIVPDDVTEIWTAAFGGCSSLTSVKLPDSLTEISPFIFESCPITEITLPSEANYIGDGAFEDCKLTSISIPSKVSSIGAWAFCGCPLTEVTVPANVEEIKHDAFNCTALSDITILNPACTLFDDVNTIYSSATIHGFAGSTAEEYANKYDRRFEALTSPASVSGDYNGDGEITVADAVLLIRFITEDSSLTQEEIDNILSGDPDINGDGLLTILDVTELLNQLQPAHKPEVTITEINVPDGLADDDRFEAVGQWYDISSPDYDGLPLSGDVFLTAPIPGAFDPENLGGYVFVYYDEETGACRYLFPDSYDLTAGTMTIDLPHFSFWGAAKLTNEEQIEAFLNSYSTKLAVARGNSKKSASELEPYVRLKAEAMGLTKQATEDLIQSSLNFLGGRFTGKNKAFIESATKYTTTLTRGFYDNDGTAALSGLEDAITDALLNSWDELKFSDRLDKVLGSEFAGSTTAKLLSSTNGIARMAGYMAGGDPPAAMKELGSILQGIHPAVELGTKAVAYLGARINEEFTNWKSNQIEELYRIYKNGAEDIWGNEVIPCNRDSFLTYLNTSSGFTMAKGVARFYKLDKVSEICEKYGWPYSTYEELPPRYIKEFQQRAEDGLMQYFELRVQQEKTAEEIKKTERACIETMMTGGYGALYSGAYRKFFGEETPDDYNLTARLERLVNVRSFVSQYVDEDKLAEAAKVDNSYNYGDILNWWVDLASNNEKSVAIQKFREELRTHGFLKEFTDQKVTSLVLEKTADDSGCSPPNSNYSEYTIFYRVKDVKTDAEGNEVIVWKDDSLKRNYPYFSPGSYKSEVWTLLKNAEISVSADGKISCSEEGVKVEGFFDPISKTGLGSLSIHTKSTYDYRERTESYCRSCITLDNHFPNDTPDYYVDRTIDLTLDLEIMPSSDGTGVLFILNGGGTVASSGEVIDTISGIIEDRSVTPKKLLEAESGLVITGRPFSDRFAVTFEDVQYLYLLK